MQSRQIGQGQDKGPRQLLSKLLLAFLDAGDMDFGRVPDDASSAGRLISLILQGMPSAETFCTASAGAIGLCQVRSCIAFLQACALYRPVPFKFVSNYDTSHEPMDRY